MAHWVYILHSAAQNRYYVGETEDYKARLDQHLDRLFPEAYTKLANDWVIMIAVECRDRSHGRAVEAYIKRQRKTSFTKRFIEDGELRAWVLVNT